ncbi:MAG: SLC13 family permease, partial [Verrucomicrobiae bacterium]|nr:SLC13 family permease [Verrucomicrobiae bacterium]
ICIVLVLLGIAIALFATEKVPIELVTLMLLVALIVLKILKPEQAFAGFSSDIIMILGSIFVLCGAMEDSGVLYAVGARIVNVAGGSEGKLLFMIMILASAFSAFMNNTTVTALLLPPIVQAARKARISPSKLLMPLAYASILGGTCTLIGTSTNVAVSGYLTQHKMPPLGMFEFTVIGVLIVVVGVAYMMTIGRRLLPDYPEESLTDVYAIREYLTEIVITPDSDLVGKKFFDSALAKMGLRILKVLRGDEEFVPNSMSLIRPNDLMLVNGEVSALMKVKSKVGVEIHPEVKVDDPQLQSRDIKMAEVLVTPQSDLLRTTIREARFRQRFGLTVLAIRHGGRLQNAIQDIRLQIGDMLLIQGPRSRLESLRPAGLAILEEFVPPVFTKRKSLITVGCFIGAILIGTLGWLPLSVSFLIGAVICVLSGCISSERAFEFIDWRLLILIGGMTAFGTAMEVTSTDDFLAHWIVQIMSPLGVVGVLAGFFVLTVALTQPMSNAAAALVVLPVALSTAEQMHVNQRTFAIAVMLAASVSFITPLEPSCILVYGPGKYKFRDFVKIGMGLTIALSILAIALIPVFWPLSQP